MRALQPQRGTPDGDFTCALDQADLVQEGSDVTILTYSRMRHHCLKAVEQLEADGISVELIDLISSNPSTWRPSVGPSARPIG